MSEEQAQALIARLSLEEKIKLNELLKSIESKRVNHED